MPALRGDVRHMPLRLHKELLIERDLLLGCIHPFGKLFQPGVLRSVLLTTSEHGKKGLEVLLRGVKIGKTLSEDIGSDVQHHRLPEILHFVGKMNSGKIALLKRTRLRDDLVHVLPGKPSGRGKNDQKEGKTSRELHADL